MFFFWAAMQEPAGHAHLRQSASMHMLALQNDLFRSMHVGGENQRTKPKCTGRNYMKCGFKIERTVSKSVCTISYIICFNKNFQTTSQLLMC